VGSVLGGPAGAAIAGGGQLIGSFQSGGIVDTPLQIVGESGPELAAMPRGTRVSSNRDTMALGAKIDRLTKVVQEKPMRSTPDDIYDTTVEMDKRRGEQTGNLRMDHTEI